MRTESAKLVAQREALGWRAILIPRLRPRLDALLEQHPQVPRDMVIDIDSDFSDYHRLEWQHVAHDGVLTIVRSPLGEHRAVIDLRLEGKALSEAMKNL